MAEIQQPAYIPTFIHLVEISLFIILAGHTMDLGKSPLHKECLYYIGSAEGHEYPDLQVGVGRTPFDFHDSSWASHRTVVCFLWESQIFERPVSDSDHIPI